MEKTLTARSKKHGNLPFKLYAPADGHPDFFKCWEQAQSQAETVKKIILKDADLTANQKRQFRHRRIKAYKTAAKNFLINRQRLKKGNHTLRPFYAIWTMLNSCNFRCSYCDNHAGVHYYDMPEAGALNTADGKRLLEIIRTGTQAIMWCGGEPTMRNDLPELLDYACDLGFFPNMINTNGSLIYQRLQKPEWSKFLWQMDTIVVSLDGLNLAKMNGLWGVKKAEQVITNILILRELRKAVKFKLTVNTVITPDTIKEAEAVLNFANDLDIWFVPVAVNFMHEPNKQLIGNPDYQRLANLILERKKQGYKIIGSEHLLKQLLFAEPIRCETTLKPHIWADGSVCFPCRASVNVRPVDINLLDYRTFDEAYEAGRKLINPDNFHGMGSNQCGGNCAWMQNYTTARYIEGITQPLRSRILSEIREFAG